MADDGPLYAMTVFAVEGMMDDELTFPAGVEIELLDTSDDYWWEGQYNGERGIFPRTYVELPGDGSGADSGDLDDGESGGDPYDEDGAYSDVSDEGAYETNYETYATNDDAFGTEVADDASVGGDDDVGGTSAPGTSQGTGGGGAAGGSAAPGLGAEISAENAALMAEAAPPPPAPSLPARGDITLQALREQADYSGWMFKQGPKMKGWKKRYCVLANMHLYYFKNEKAKKPLGFFSVAFYNIKTNPEAKRPNAFLVSHQGVRTYSFATETGKQMNIWITILSQAAQTQRIVVPGTHRTSIFGVVLDTVTRPGVGGRAPADYKGYCDKKGRVNKAWKRRFLALREGVLYYYKSEADEKELGKTPVYGYDVLRADTTTGKAFSFQLSHQGCRTYIFNADSGRDMLIWLTVLRQASNLDPVVVPSADTALDQDRDDDSISAYDLKPVADYYGYVEKKGKVNKSYKNRLLLLHDRIIYYYKNEFALKPQGSCNIISYHVDMGDPKVTGRQFSFVLSNTGMRTYVFAVKNQLQLDTWMGVLKQAVDVTQDIEPPENPLKRAASRATMLKRRTYITASMRISEEKGLSLEDMATEGSYEPPGDLPIEQWPAERLEAKMEDLQEAIQKEQKVKGGIMTLVNCYHDGSEVKASALDQVEQCDVKIAELEEQLAHCRGLLGIEDEDVAPLEVTYEGERHVALWDYMPRAPGEMDIRAGQVCYVFHKGSDGWWKAEKDGIVGLLPYNYLSPC